MQHHAAVQVIEHGVLFAVFGGPGFLYLRARSIVVERGQPGVQSCPVRTRRAGAGRQEILLQAARQMQLSLMPAKDPDIEGLDIAGVSIPAEEVGGDLSVWEVSRAGISDSR